MAEATTAPAAPEAPPAAAEAAPADAAASGAADEDPRFRITDADRAAAREYIAWLVEKRLGPAKRPVEKLDVDGAAEKQAARHEKLVAQFKAWGASEEDLERTRNEVKVTVEQRKGGSTAGGLDYYFFTRDGKRHRSNGEVYRHMFKKPAPGRSMKGSATKAPKAPAAKKQRTSRASAVEAVASAAKAAETDSEDDVPVSELARRTSGEGEPPKEMSDTLKTFFAPRK